ncbi:MAG: hypothetical protein IJ796_06010 [Lachnospiraceae bacterium]|nr:hypothetical protein [Lachnospiraceae bacterium]
MQDYISSKTPGAGIEKYSDGIYYVYGIINIPIQIVVIKELPPKEHIVLRALVKDLSDEEARAFIKNSQGYTSPDDRNNADAVMQVSISANRELYELLQEEFYMCEALMELMKDKVDQRVEEQVKQRVEEQLAQRVEEQLEQRVEERLEQRVEERLEQRVEEQIEERTKERVLTTLYDLVKKNLLNIKDAAMQAGISESAFTAGLNKYSA